MHVNTKAPLVFYNLAILSCKHAIVADTVISPR